MLARFTVEIEAEEADPRRPEAIQMADLARLLLQRLGVAVPALVHPPNLRDVRILHQVCVSSARHTTPMEGAVTAFAEDITRKIQIEPEPGKKT